jgi:hypothetical protein
MWRARFSVSKIASGDARTFLTKDTARGRNTLVQSGRPLHAPELSKGIWRYENVGFRAAAVCAEPDHRRSYVAHEKIPPLTHKEMSALASRFEARAASVLLRDQPQLQSDMRLAARLIHEWTGRAGTDQPPAATPAVEAIAARRTARG